MTITSMFWGAGEKGGDCTNCATTMHASSKICLILREYTNGREPNVTFHIV